MDRELRDHADLLLEDLASGALPGADAATTTAVAAVARRARALLRGATREELLTGATGTEDPHEAAACALAAALAGSTVLEVADDVATFAAVAGGLATAVPNVALDTADAGPVTALLGGSDGGAPAPRPQRLTELFVAGTLVRAHSHAVSLEDGLAATARVEEACAAVEAVDVDDLLRHVYGDAVDAADTDPAGRAALAAGTLPLNVLQRITGGILAADREVTAKGWARAAAVLVTVAHAADLTGVGIEAVRGTAARLASDPTLLGRPETTITDLLTTLLGLQAAIALGGAGDDAPVRHLLARVLAHGAIE